MRATSFRTSVGWTNARLLGRSQDRLDGRQQRVDVERFAEKRRLSHVDETVWDLAGIARDVNDLDPAPPELGQVAHGDPVRLKKRHLDVGDQEIEYSGAVQQHDRLVGIARI